MTSPIQPLLPNRHATEDYARIKSGLTPNNLHRLASETYADSVFGVTTTSGSPNRVATEPYVDALVIRPPGGFIDYFTRVDNPNLGGDWVNMAAGGFVIQSSKAAPEVNTFCVAVRDLPETSGDHKATITVGALGETVAVLGPIVRAPDILGTDLATTEGFYVLTVTGANFDTIAIRKHVRLATGMTLVGTLVTGTPVSVGDTLRLEAEGDQLRGYLNGILVVTRTDATVPGTQMNTGMFANQTLLSRVSEFASDVLGTVNPPTAPGVPTNVVASIPAGTNYSATVTWVAPVDDGGSAITGYQITVLPGGRLINFPAALTRDVNQLTAGTSYTFTVTARNAVGLGQASTASNAVTPTGNTVGPPVTLNPSRYYDVASVNTTINAATTVAGVQSAMSAFGTAYGMTILTPTVVGGTNGVSWQAFVAGDLALVKTNAKALVDELAKYPPEFVVATVMATFYIAKSPTFDSNGSAVGGVSLANGTIIVVTNSADALYFKNASQHEFGHTIQRSVSEWETEWNTYNPPGFIYQDLSLQPPYTGTHPNGFMNDYCRGAIYEDFADTHKYMISTDLYPEGQAIVSSDTRVASKVAELRTKMRALDSRVGQANFYHDATTVTVNPGAQVFRDGNWWERPLPANAPVHPNNRNFLLELNGQYAVGGAFAGGPVNAQGDRYIAFVGGVSPQPSPSAAYDTPIYRVGVGTTSYQLTVLQGAFNVPNQFKAGGEGIRIPEIAKAHFSSTGTQSNDAPMCIIDTDRGYYANLASTKWNSSLGHWEVQSTGAASVYYFSSYGHAAGHPGWPTSLVQYDDEPRNQGFRGNNPMTRAIEYARMIDEGGVKYVTECFAVRTAAYHVFPLVGEENNKGGLIGEGVRMRLKPSLSDATIRSRLSASGLSGNRLEQAILIATGWRDYGCVIGDNSGSGSRVKLESFYRRNVTNQWLVDEGDLKIFDFNPDTGDWVFIQDEYFPPGGGTTDTTAPPVPAAPGVAETATNAVVTWARVSDPDPVTYKVYRDNTLKTTTTALTWTDTAVTIGATYVYKVSASDPVPNESAKSAGTTVTIPGTTETTPPSVPTGLTATASGANQINLDWTASTDTGGSGMAQYRIKRGTGVLTTISSTATAYQDTGLTASTTYTYSVAAIDGAGNVSAYSTTASATTGGSTGNAPGIPPNVQAYMTSDTMVTVRWGESTGTVAAQKYKVYRSGPGGGAATIYVNERTPVAPAGGQGTGFNKMVTATDLTAATQYSFAVSAVSSGGVESAKSATLNVTTAAAKASPVGNVQIAYLAGDIGISGTYQPNTRATGLIIQNATDKNFVLTLGDNAYSNGTIDDFNNNYNPGWGAFKAITYPAVGNHDTPPGYTGYKSYFGTAKVPSTYPAHYVHYKGNWMFIALDSNVRDYTDTGGTYHPDRTNQVAWLTTQLNNRPTTVKGICAYWHHARWTSTTDADDTTMDSCFSILNQHGTDVCLQGHDHHYERFAKLNAAGQPSATGMRFFVVGTGGSGRRGLKDTFETNSEQIIGGDMRGVLQMKFGDNGYSWRWKGGTTGVIYADTGTSTATKPNPSTGDDSGFNLVNPK